jgi:hypothetical protein
MTEPGKDAERLVLADFIAAVPLNPTKNRYPVTVSFLLSGAERALIVAALRSTRDVRVAMLEKALEEAIVVFDGMNDDEIDVELLPRLRAAAQPRVEQEWQPIETAPKDGTQILAYWDSGMMTCTDITLWYEGKWSDPECTEVEYADPTHWMPLPTPPSLTDPPKEDSTATAESGGGK